MKILFWTDGYWPRVGGIETQAIQFIDGMRQRGHEFMVLAQKDDPNWLEDELFNGVLIKRFDFDSIIPNFDLAKLRPIHEYLEHVLSKFQPDILHLNTCNGWSAFVFILLKNILRLPIILTVHSPFYYGNEKNHLFKKVAHFADHICCVSNWVLKETAKLCPHEKAKMRVIHNGLAFPLLKPDDLNFALPTFLLSGRLTFEKGFDTAIRAFSLLKKSGSNARLMVVGGGNELEALQKLGCDLELNDSIQFVGKFPREEIPSFINQATIAVVPSYFESFGLSPLEAMQMGRPVIATQVGGLQEVVVAGKTGLLVPPQDPQALFEAMKMLIDNPERCIQMGSAGRRRAEEFTLLKNMIHYEEVYHESLVLD